MQSGCWVPLLNRGETIGVLMVASRREDAFGPAQAQMLTEVGTHMAMAVSTAMAYRQIAELRDKLSQEKHYLEEEINLENRFEDIVGESAGLKQVLKEIETVAPTDATVLIEGETGTGKELVAHEIHRRSRRSDKPLVRVNCASIPKDLYESEFFGHAKGAYTGAIKDRAGRFEAAEGGTIFLDEIGEVPLELQSKLLRVLHERSYERVGEDRTRRADVRIIAATNRDLKREAAAGRFREDLYYRLNVFPIQVAPLHERRDDIPLLAQHFIKLSVREMGSAKPRLTRAGIIQLQSYDWPGNIRELRNVIERAVILAHGGTLQFDLPTTQTPPPVSSLKPRAENTTNANYLTEAQMRQYECDNIRKVLEEAGWKIKGPNGAAELLGLNPATLVSRIRQMKLKRPTC